MTSADTRRGRARGLLGGACLLFVTLASEPRSAGSQLPPGESVALAVVVPATSADTMLSLAQLRRIFAGQQQFWSGGMRITLLVPQRGTPERLLFLTMVAGMSEREFTRYWIGKTFRDEVPIAPKLSGSGLMTLRVLEAVPGAIGVVAALPASRAVRVVRIDGKLPGDRSYPLRAVR